MLVTTIDDARSLNALLADSGRNALLRERLLSDPRAALASASLKVRSDIEVRPVESTAGVRYLVIPTPPEEGAVSDDELAGATGGATPTVVLAVSCMVLVATLLPALVVTAVVEGSSGDGGS